jgi:cell division protease FtsH
MIAYHEGGHTLVAKLLPGSDPVHKVTIIPRGPALGYTLQLPLEDRYLTTRTEINNKLAILLAGRAAEELVFSEITTGAGNDLSKATEMVQKMVCEFGMSERLGPMTFRKKEEELFLGKDIGRDRQYSEQTAVVIDAEVTMFIHEAHERAKKILSDNRKKLDGLASALVEREILNGEEIDDVIAGKELKPIEKKTGKPVESASLQSPAVVSAAPAASGSSAASAS